MDAACADAFDVPPTDSYGCDRPRAFVIPILVISAWHARHLRKGNVMAIDSTAMFAMSYGLYVVSAEADGTKAGCVVNTAVQVTAEPIRMTVAVHKDNVTSGAIAKAGAFTVTAIDQTADMPTSATSAFAPVTPMTNSRNTRRQSRRWGAPIVRSTRARYMHAS